MSDLIERAKTAIEECSQEERRILRRYIQKLQPHELERAWGTEADVILDAIVKSSDLTKRGFRGILAEAYFESAIVPTLGNGWAAADINRNEDLPYDSLLVKEDEHVKIQVKLQRSVKNEPMLYYPKHYEAGSLYVVEVQKTRTGTATAKETLPDSDKKVEVTKAKLEDTRPYRFGQFDILAVCMHPSTNNWGSFRYTLGKWLLPKAEDATLIATLQPVAKGPNDVWTDDLAICLRWLKEDDDRRVLKNLKHIKAKPTKKKKKTKRKAKPKQKPLF